MEPKRNLKYDNNEEDAEICNKNVSGVWWAFGF